MFFYFHTESVIGDLQPTTPGKGGRPHLAVTLSDIYKVGYLMWKYYDTARRKLKLVFITEFSYTRRHIVYSRCDLYVLTFTVCARSRHVLSVKTIARPVPTGHMGMWFIIVAPVPLLVAWNVSD